MFSRSAGFQCLLALILAFIFSACYAKPTASTDNREVIDGIKTNNCSSLIHASTNPTFGWVSSNPDALTLARDCLQSHIPPTDSCVFYTSNSRDNAILFAAERKKETIYDVYPAHWFNLTSYPARKWVENGVLRDVFRVTSRGYAMSCSGAATLVIPETEEPCQTSIWVTDELDAIRTHVSGITEVFRASLVKKIGGYWNWVVSKLIFDDGQENIDPKTELKKRKIAWQSIVEKAATWSAESQTVLDEKLKALEEYGSLAEEWAEATAGRCRS